MAISKKGKRKITVGKNVFYSSCDHNSSLDKLILRVMTEEKAFSQLICEFNHTEVWEPSGDTWAITPRIVRQSIKYGLAKGWNPYKKGKHFFLSDMDEKLGIREKVNFDKTYKDFAMWILTQDKSKKLKAFNFGLFETENGYSVYLIGSSTYDENDDDWACNEKFISEPRYLELPESFVKEKTWQRIQDELSEMIKKFIDSKYLRISLLSEATVITIGFDDGDLKQII